MQIGAVDKKWASKGIEILLEILGGTSRKLLLMTSSRRLEVRMIGLLGPGEKRQLKNTLVRMGSQGEIRIAFSQPQMLFKAPIPPPPLF
jgi:hypothetical protein